MKKYIILLSLLGLTGCPDENCNMQVTNSTSYQNAFDHCMDKAATISKSGTHDNSYNTVEECQNYATRVDDAICREKAK